MNTYHKKGIGQFLENSISSKKIINELNHYYQIMEEKERRWFKKIIAGIKTTQHEIKFNQEKGYYSLGKQLISINDEIGYCFFHEIGHYIDFQINSCKISETAIKIFIKEFNKKNIDVKTYLMSNRDYSYKDTTGLIFDSICIYYAINPLRYNFRGHDPNHYFNCEEKGAGMELFAEFFAVKFMHKKEMSFFKKEFPKTFYYLNSEINKLIK